MKQFAIPAVAAAIVALVALALITWDWTGGPEATAPAMPPPATNAGPSASDMTPAAPATVPSFDVVRVTREGNAVFGGRAEPGAEITIYDHGVALGTVIADPRGEWVFVPANPLPPGTREITIIARKPGGDTIASDRVVVLVVPERGEGAGQPLIVLSPRNGGGPSRVEQGAGLGTAPTGPTIDVVDYDEKGQVILSGRAAGGSDVRLYADGAFIGAARTGADGAWSLKVERAIAPGEHELRVDQVDAQGKVAARAAIPFSRAAPSQAAAQEGRVIVQPGNSLWRIARATYGHGTQYTVIYAANRGQIRDSDLIYPGQIFQLPRGN